MSNANIGPAEGTANHLAWELDREAADLIRDLQSIIHTVESIQDDVKVGNFAWWAAHNQGIIHSATRIDRQLNRCDALKKAIGIAEGYVTIEKEAASNG